MARLYLKKLWKVGRWLLGLPLLLVIVVLILVNTNVGQRQITRQVEQYLQQELQTELGIGRINIGIPYFVGLEDVYINTPQKDTLIRLAELGVNIDMWALLNQEVIIEDVVLSGLFTRLVTTESGSNFDFITAAFVTTDTSIEKAAPANDTTAMPWSVQLSGASLSLSDIEVAYQDDPNGLDLALQLRKGVLTTDSIDLETSTFLLEQLQLTDLRGSFFLETIEDTPVDTTSASALLAGSQSILLENIDWTLRLDSLDVQTQLSALKAGNLRAQIDDHQHVSLEELRLSPSQLRVDQLGSPQLEGFDPNHLALSKVEVALKDLVFQEDSLQLILDQLSVIEQSGLELKNVNGRIRYEPELISWQDGQLQTAESSLAIEELWLVYPFTAPQPPSTFRLRLNSRGEVGIRDIQLLAPQLTEKGLLARHPNGKIRFNADASGYEKQLAINQFIVRAPGFRIQANGQVKDVLNPERLRGEFSLRELQVQPRDILPLLPADVLPPYINWPEQIIAQGRASYYNEQLELDLQTEEQRIASSPSSKIQVRGQVLRPTSFPDTWLDIQLDTLRATRTTVNSYLPPATLPDGYRLPDFLEASGSVKGPIDDLTLAIQLDLPGDQTYARLGGTVQQIMDPAELQMDLEISSLSIRPVDVEPLLPDSLLPAELALPDMLIEEASLQGRLDDLQFSIPMRTSNGRWLAQGRYNPEDVQLSLSVQNLRLADLTQGALRDSLLRLELQPINLETQVAGQLEPEINLNIQTHLEEGDNGELLDLTAQITGSEYQANWTFSHPGISGRGEGYYAMVDSVVQVEGTLQLETFDFNYWGLSEDALRASGRVSLASNGLELDQMEAQLLVDDLLLRGVDATSFVDSLFLRARLDQGDNTISISSDIMEAELTGTFQPLAVAEEFGRFVTGYWSENVPVPDPVVNGNRVDFDLRITNPIPFTSGFIIGLEELSPLSMSLVYRDQEPELLVDLDLPLLQYQGIRLEDMTLEMRGDDQKLQLVNQWNNISVGEDIEIGRTRITAQGEASTPGDPGRLETALTVFSGDSIRHQLAFQYRESLQDGQEIIMAPEQILNFNSWTFPQDNRIAWKENSLTIEQWTMRKQGRFIRLADQEGQDLLLSFQDFNLQTLGRMINTEEELIYGRVNGEMVLENVLEQMGIQADILIQDLAYRSVPLGDLSAKMRNSDNDDIAVQAKLIGSGNELSVDGKLNTVSSELNMMIQVDTLQLESAEPFSMGYLEQTDGYLEGNLAVGGTFTQPRIDGTLSFQKAAFAIGLLGSRFRLDEQAIQFDGSTIRLQDFTLQDSLGNPAVTTGTIQLRSVDDIALDLKIRARNFQAISSTEQDNDLFYGQLWVDANVDISGDLVEPRVEVTATPQRNSNLTYQYTATDNARLETTQGVVTFAESYEWATILETGERDTVESRSTGMYIQTNLSINENLRLRVIVDPLTQQEFSGRGEGDITFIQYPDGRQEMTGQVTMQTGTYNMVLEGLQPYTFSLDEGSQVSFTGDPANPQLDLQIRNTVRTSPLSLVKMISPDASLAGLRQPQTFAVVLDLDGDLQAMNIDADILYPENAYNNKSLPAVTSALDRLRQDKSRIYVTAITLMTFKNFVLPLTDSSEGTPNGIVNGVAGAVGDALGRLLNQRLKFVEVDLGVENYQTDSGEENYNVRLSLQKSFFDDRLIISVDGVTNTAEDATTEEAQTYLDNVSVEYLLDPGGELRIKLFNDRDRPVFVGGNVLRFGGRLVFQKDFDRFIWKKN